MKKDKLEINKYPLTYQKYLQKEKVLVKDFIKRGEKILDVGCGSGRIIPLVIKSAREYTGVDVNSEYLKAAENIARRYKNAKIIKLNAEKLSKKFKGDSFDKTICLWNTIGCLKNDKKVIGEMSKVTKEKAFFTVISKGNLEKRKEYYENFGIKYKINRKTEVISSKEWGKSRAYSKKDIRRLIFGTGFRIIRIKNIDDFAYAVYLSK